MKLLTTDAQYLVALAISKHDDTISTGEALINIGTMDVPKGMVVENIGRHRFVAMRELAYYGAHGRLREEGSL